MKYDFDGEQYQKAAALHGKISHRLQTVVPNIIWDDHTLLIRWLAEGKQLIIKDRHAYIVDRPWVP